MEHLPRRTGRHSVSGGANLGLGPAHIPIAITTQMCAGPVRGGGERTGHAARNSSYRPYRSLIPHTVQHRIGRSHASTPIDAASTHDPEHAMQPIMKDKRLARGFLRGVERTQSLKRGHMGRLGVESPFSFAHGSACGVRTTPAHALARLEPVAHVSSTSSRPRSAEPH